MKSLNRRKFLKTISAISLSSLILPKNSKIFASDISSPFTEKIPPGPIVISTWEHGLPANAKAWEILQARGSALDAVEKGVNVAENDPEVQSVGLGGIPDRDGFVTLDACIMDKFGNAGAVAFIQGYKNPISIARLVMEKTNHILLAGKGAEKFAAQNGFKKTKLLTEEAKQKWQNWLNKNPDLKKHHDTIGMVAIDHNGDLAAACSTSGLAFKMHGRVGDSPIIGAGLYLDNEVGAAAATGIGEECWKVLGSFVVVEAMRDGAPPEIACKQAVERIAHRHRQTPNFQVAFVALNKNGEFGAYSLIKGFTYALMKDGQNYLYQSNFLF